MKEGWWTAAMVTQQRKAVVEASHMYGCGSANLTNEEKKERRIRRGDVDYLVLQRQCQEAQTGKEQINDEILPSRERHHELWGCNGRHLGVGGEISYKVRYAHVTTQLPSRLPNGGATHDVVYKVLEQNCKDAVLAWVKWS